MKYNLPYYPLPWPEPFVPAYHQARIGDWRCAPVPGRQHMTFGYFRPHNHMDSGWMFEQKTRNKWVKWMSLTPMELESHMPHIAAAKGTVVVAGLGMGFYVYNIIRKPEVTRVIVLEKDPNLVTLFNRSSNRSHWGALNKKFELVMGDALEYQPNFDVDFLYADIWELLGDERAVPLTKTIQANVGAKAVGYWGQEWDFLDWCRNNTDDPWKVTKSDWKRFVDDNELPLIGGEFPRYPRLAVAAVSLQVVATMLRQDRSDLKAATLFAQCLEVVQDGFVLDKIIKPDTMDAVRHLLGA